MSQKKGQQRGRGQATQPGSSSMTSKEENSYADLRDSFVPLFSGQPADYKEWRQRIQLGHRKMSVSKRAQESVLNIVGSFRGAVWRLFEDWSLEQLEKEDAFEKMLVILDGNYAYDQRVQLPTDFEGYFNLLQRQPGQTLLMYVGDYEESYRKRSCPRMALASPCIAHQGAKTTRHAEGSLLRETGRH